MIKNYIKTAWRNILQNKFYATINVTGLTVGLVVGLFMLLWVQDELSFDKNNSKAKNIYKVGIVGGTGISKQIFNHIIAPVATFAKSEIPEVKDAVRVMPLGDAPFKYKDKVFYETNFAFTDPSYFTVFDFNLIKGDKRNPFPDNSSIVITESTAKRYFGNEDPIGKIVITGQDEQNKVTGVIADYPANSSFQYHVLMPISRFNDLAYIKSKKSYDNKTIISSMDADWSNFGFETYLLLKNDNVNTVALEKKLQAIHERQNPVDAPVPYLTQPLLKMHLYKADGTDAGMSTVSTFAIVALMLLVIACINYVNLSTARSMLRAKEVSMRKIIGAGKFQLFMQFMVETALLFVIASVFAFVLLILLLPEFNQFSGKQIALNFSNYNIWLCILLTLVGTLAASSIYPALLLLSFEPLKALKGKISVSIGNVAFRRTLVVLQFSASIILIIGTLVIGNQLRFIRNKNLGYDKENVFSFSMRNDMQKHFDVVKTELLKNPAVLSVTRAGRDIITNGSSTGNIDWDGKPANSNMWFNQVYADKDLIPFFKMKLLSGDNFTGVVADSAHFIINETAVKEMGLKDPIGKRLRIQARNGTIIGVVKDFHFTTIHKKIEPAVFQYQPNYCWKVYVKTTGRDAQQAIAAAIASWKQYNNDVPFNYAFLDDTYTKMYTMEQKQGSLFNLFATIAIVISCLGLFGLATYSAQVKTREIGIRKVLGASVAKIIRLLATEFMVLIIIAIVIAMPIAWFAMNSWLQDFAYKINIGWVVFLFAGGGASLIALATISIQSIKAALANPVKSLRSE
ncbi:MULTISPECIES: ABC transporter permease [unclassified Mucilaginibacter]|uniref:ABC transporter permease n=5 Tax=Mucilaginibacter TaxID=423349 RepID=UPI002AC8A098|nr:MULTISPECIES: ABC transporter permease [unclassified Mucilaginibacter]MEB0279946.1 ABC transporter permease [Mucilaginibacter sp. 10B2]WPX21904.1 ABC transporter permease [Mucilaginibacter sp. 5C4]